MARVYRGLEIKTIGEHLRAIRAIPRVPYGWAWAHDAIAPSGLYLPAPWLLEELPELAEPELNSWLEMFRSGIAKRESKLSRWAWLLAIPTGIVLLIQKIVFGIPIFSTWSFIFAVPIALLVVFAMIRAISRAGRSIPKSAGFMVITTNKDFRRDFAMLPLEARDILVADLVAQMGLVGKARARVVRFIIWFALYAVIPIGLALMTGDYVRSLFSIWTVVVLFDLNYELSRGMLVHTFIRGRHQFLLGQYRTLLAKRASRSIKFPGLIPILITRWPPFFRRTWRLLKRGSHFWALIAFNAVLTLNSLAGICAMIITMILPEMWPALLAYLLVNFVWARSPAAGRFQASERYFFRLRLREIDFLYRVHRRASLRELR